MLCDSIGCQKKGEPVEGFFIHFCDGSKIMWNINTCEKHRLMLDANGVIHVTNSAWMTVKLGKIDDD